MSESMKPNRLEDRIQAVRRFNRFYTNRLGVLREGLLESPFSLTEARIIFEVARRGETTSSHLCQELALDAGYLSRIASSLEETGLLEKTRSPADGRIRLLRLTAAGQEAFEVLNGRANHQVGEWLGDLPEEDQGRLLSAMKTIEGILGTESVGSEPLVLRPLQPGDIGWVTHRHGALYADEYGWDETFEALVASILSDFVRSCDARKERAWLAEMDGRIVGSVFVVRASDAVAKLRLLLVEPEARGRGLGSRLVEECIRFARRAGYEKLTLWTNSVLVEARRIYEKKGFVKVDEQAHHSYGHDLIGENWALRLR